MAEDALTTNVMVDGNRNYVVQLQNTSDGTGESANKKIDISTLTFSDGSVPLSLTLVEAQWNIQGFTAVNLLWDADTDDSMLTLNGNGYKNFDGVGGLHDPRSTGFTGDVFLTTVGASSGDTYDIILKMKKEA